MQVVHERCAGLDVHKKTVVACRITPDPQTRRGWQKEIRTFGTTTRELIDLALWLKSVDVTHVAMESTGIYWKPVYNILEGDFEVSLVNARHIKYVPGRKTDVKDAQWIGELIQHGLVRASYVPKRAQRELRDLTRYRGQLVVERTREVNRESIKNSGLGNLFLHFRLDVEMRIPSLELSVQIFIEYLNAHLEQVVSAPSRPAHLLFFSKAFGNNLIDSRFYKAC